MRRCITLLAAGMLTACTIFPTHELTAYSDAFNAAMSETESLIVEYDQILKAEAKASAGASGAQGSQGGFGFPTSITLASLSPDSQSGPIDLRREALMVVRQYNTALKMLAEGKSETEISNSVDGLVKGLNSVADLIGAGADVIPGGEAVVKLATTIVSALQRVENRAQFKRALVDGAPIIRTYLDLLRSDAAAIYKYRAGAAISTMSTARTRIRLELFELVSLINGAAGDNKGKMDGWKAQLLAVLKQSDLSNVTVGFKAGTDGGSAFDSVVITQMTQSIGQLQDVAEYYAATKSNQIAFQETMLAYGRLIDGVEQSLAILRAEAVAPTNLNQQARALLMFAFEVKKGWAAVRDTKA